MENPIQTVSLGGLVIGLLPAGLAVLLMYRWSLGAGTAVYAIGRMLAQLLLIGYVLTFIFETRRAGVVLGVLGIMLVAACWISLRPLAQREPRLYAAAFLGISAGGCSVLALVTALVVDVSPWFAPRYVIPLAGMIFAGSMNAVSLAAERFAAERRAGRAEPEARDAAMQAALIPVINSLFAVGIVSLPGMMTGQILSGVSPLIAARYQIVVMSMLLGAASLSAAIFLTVAHGRSDPGRGPNMQAS